MTFPNLSRRGGRSLPLAGELRRAGYCAKDATPFSDFLWADFLRRRIKRRLVEDNYDDALKKAMALARSKEAAYLPGCAAPRPTIDAALMSAGPLVDRIHRIRVRPFHRSDVEIDHHGLLIAAYQNAFQRLIIAGIDLLVRHVGRHEDEIAGWPPP